MITIIPIEPLSDEHGMLIIEAFNRFFVDKGGQEDGDGAGWGMSNGDGWGDGCSAAGGNYNKCPEDWRTE